MGLDYVVGLRSYHNPTYFFRQFSGKMYRFATTVGEVKFC